MAIDPPHSCRHDKRDVNESVIQSILAESFIRVAVVSPELRVADVTFNVKQIRDALDALGKQGVRLAIFPELAITGYTCADLFFQPTLRDAAEAAVAPLTEAVKTSGVSAVVGLPIEIGNRLYNAAMLIDENGPAGIVPKSYLPSSNEFYEERWFSRAGVLDEQIVEFGGMLVPVGADLLFRAESDPHFCLGIEICEDLWSVEPPSGGLALAGAMVIANPSASDELLGKADYRRSLVVQQSARCLATYLYASAGPGESSTDLVYSGHCIIAENGGSLAETTRFEPLTTWAIADIDVDFLVSERLKSSSFSATAPNSAYRVISFALGRPEHVGDGRTLMRKISPSPFVPEREIDRGAHCSEVFAIQSAGLATRLRHIPGVRPVIGISGGLDSTLALLVCIEAMKKTHRNPSEILAVSMPGPGSTSLTQTNARALADLLGVEVREIPIHQAVQSHLRDIGHADDNYDTTFENAQARERTQILMDLANQVGGIVVGTGDLSEAALGWCTYSGDHLSMYHVNIGVPKTLVRYVIEWVGTQTSNNALATTLRSIGATPITPELLPLSADGDLVQRTEDTLGSYELHDFFLFHTVRRNARPRKVFALACHAFQGRFEPTLVLETLKTFYRRFFSNQFKRSAMPDGPKVGTVALSPRGDWRMPSDARADLWLAECDSLSKHE